VSPRHAPVERIILKKAIQDTFMEGKQRCIEFNDGSATAHWTTLEYL
jgi:hypothetical protein